MAYERQKMASRPRALAVLSVAYMWARQGAAELPESPHRVEWASQETFPHLVCASREGWDKKWASMFELALLQLPAWTPSAPCPPRAMVRSFGGAWERFPPSWGALRHHGHLPSLPTGNDEANGQRRHGSARTATIMPDQGLCTRATPNVYGTPERVRWAKPSSGARPFPRAHFALSSWLKALGPEPKRNTCDHQKNMDQASALAAFEYGNRRHRDHLCGRPSPTWAIKRGWGESKGKGVGKRPHAAWTGYRGLPVVIVADRRNRRQGNPEVTSEVPEHLPCAPSDMMKE